MDVLLESPLIKLERETGRPGNLVGRSLSEWNEAYVTVECYFHALRVRNKLLLGQLVIYVLKRAMERAPQNLQRSATELSVEEMNQVVNEWFAEVLEVDASQADDMLSTRGRLALLLADMPGKWQDQFLQPAPWPQDFVTAMRETYLRAGPDFQLSKMMPRPLDLGPITTLTNLSRLRIFKYAAVVFWVVLGISLIILFYRTH